MARPPPALVLPTHWGPPHPLGSAAAQPPLCPRFPPRACLRPLGPPHASPLPGGRLSHCPHPRGPRPLTVPPPGSTGVNELVPESQGRVCGDRAPLGGRPHHGQPPAHRAQHQGTLAAAGAGRTPGGGAGGAGGRECCCSPGRGSPELPAQLLEEKADGEEAQGGWGGEHAGPVILQVPPQAAGEGLRGEGAERPRPGAQAQPRARDSKGALVLGTGVAATRQPRAPRPWGSQGHRGEGRQALCVGANSEKIPDCSATGVPVARLPWDQALQQQGPAELAPSQGACRGPSGPAPSTRRRRDGCPALTPHMDGTPAAPPAPTRSPRPGLHPPLHRPAPGHRACPSALPDSRPSTGAAGRVAGDPAQPRLRGLNLTGVGVGRQRVHRHTSQWGSTPHHRGLALHGRHACLPLSRGPDVSAQVCGEATTAKYPVPEE